MREFSSRANLARSALRRALIGSTIVVMVAAVATGVVAFGGVGDSIPAVVTAPPAQPTAAPGVNPVAAENAKPGDYGWTIRSGSGSDLEGYASRTSVAPGERLRLFVSSREPTFSVDFYRMGYYQAAGARKVLTRQDVRGVRQSPPRVDPSTNMVEARWTPSLELTIPSSWTTGAYLARLRTSDDRASYIPFTVREAGGRRAPIVFQSSVTTWQAYNLWGGHSLYAGIKDGARGRADVVSFDRPYSWGNGAADFLGLELPLISWLEQNSYDVAYATNIDLHSDPGLLDGRRAFLSLGHDEYWSAAMRDQAESAQTQGVNMAFFGANAAFRAIRLQDSPTGPNRREVNYRTVKGDKVAEQDPRQATVSWRDPPLRRPEDKMIGGVMYECNPVKGDTVVQQSLSWLFRDTGLKPGDVIYGIVGSEYDRVFDGRNRPRDQWLLARAPVRCKGQSSVQDTVFSRLESGAGVFAAGTSNFLCVFSGCGTGIPKDERVQRLVRNLLDAYLSGIPAAAETPKPFPVGRPIGPAPSEDRSRSRPVPKTTFRPAYSTVRPRPATPHPTQTATRYTPVRTPRRPDIQR